MNRFDETISIVDAKTDTVAGTMPLRYDPEPPVVHNGRHHLYNAAVSGHGDSACASCHIFGDFDSLAWDLGDPTGQVAQNFGPAPGGSIVFNHQPFHPMKGPMTTQSLRGMAGQGPMHWRGDRNGGDVGQAGNDDLAFKKFNPAFVSLLGNATQLSAADLQEFTNFILTVQYPPNPIANLDGTRTMSQQAGFTRATVGATDTEATCAGCHVLPKGAASPAFLTFENEPQEFKVAHWRNAYQKIGMFGTPGGLGAGTGDPFLGDQVRGFGFLHDGSIATIFNFLHAVVFTLNDTERRDLEQFVLTTPTGLAPIVGQQVTVTAANLGNAGVVSRNLLVGRANAGDCDLIVKGALGGQARGWVWRTATSQFASDRSSDAPIGEPALRNQVATAGQERTYTCVPPGSGNRIGIDRDEDGFPDSSSCTQPASTPGSGRHVALRDANRTAVVKLRRRSGRMH